MQDEFSLWNYQFEEVMASMIDDNEEEEKKNGDNNNNDDGGWFQMSSGWSDDDDDEKNPEKINRPTLTHQTLETIVLRHKSKLQDENLSDILTMVLQAKEKEAKCV